MRAASSATTAAASGHPYRARPRLSLRRANRGAGPGERAAERAVGRAGRSPARPPRTRYAQSGVDWFEQLTPAEIRGPLGVDRHLPTGRLDDPGVDHDVGRPGADSRPVRCSRWTLLRPRRRYVLTVSTTPSRCEQLARIAVSAPKTPSGPLRGGAHRGCRDRSESTRSVAVRLCPRSCRVCR